MYHMSPGYTGIGRQIKIESVEVDKENLKNYGTQTHYLPQSFMIKKFSMKD